MFSSLKLKYLLIVSFYQWYEVATYPNIGICHYLDQLGCGPTPTLLKRGMLSAPETFL